MGMNFVAKARLFGREVMHGNKRLNKRSLQDWFVGYTWGWAESPVEFTVDRFFCETGSPGDVSACAVANKGRFFFQELFGVNNIWVYVNNSVAYVVNGANRTITQYTVDDGGTARLLRNYNDGEDVELNIPDGGFQIRFGVRSLAGRPGTLEYDERARVWAETEMRRQEESERTGVPIVRRSYNANTPSGSLSR